MCSSVEEGDGWRAREVFVRGARTVFGFEGGGQSLLSLGHYSGGGRHGGFVALVARGQVVLKGIHIWWQLCDLAESDGQVEGYCEGYNM